MPFTNGWAESLCHNDRSDQCIHPSHTSAGLGANFVAGIVSNGGGDLVRVSQERGEG